jgi:hypothetical protein
VRRTLKAAEHADLRRSPSGWMWQVQNEGRELGL